MGPEIKGRPNKAWRNWNLTIFKEFFCRMQSRDNFHIKKSNQTSWDLFNFLYLVPYMQRP